MYAWRVRGNRHALATWRHVAHNAPAMCSAVVLTACVGMPSTEVDRQMGQQAAQSVANWTISRLYAG